MHPTIKSDRMGRAKAHPADRMKLILVAFVIVSLVHDRLVIRPESNPAGRTP